MVIGEAMKTFNFDGLRGNPWIGQKFKTMMDH